MSSPAALAPLDFPMRKLLCAEVQLATAVSAGDVESWRITIAGRVVPIKLCWLQGYVRDVVDDSIELVDKSGAVRVRELKKNPTPVDWLADGLYCSVVGLLRCDPGTGVVYVSVRKLINLKDAASEHGVKFLEDLWYAEIADLRAMLESGELN